MPTPNEHALLSASSAHRWLHCTAAPRFEEQFSEQSTAYAEEGRLAHSICELFGDRYFGRIKPATFTRRLHKLQGDPLYSEEMLRTADFYLGVIKEIANNYPETPFVAQEIRVDYSDIVPEGFGTCDCAVIGGDTLHIIDYKHGKGVPVSAEGNPQMRLYAWGALRLFYPVYGESIKRVITHIVQPRITETVSFEELTIDELTMWGVDTVKPQAQKAYNHLGVFVPGDYCRFCRGAAQCRARAEKYSAFEDFKNCIFGHSDDQTDGPILSDKEIGELLHTAAGLKQWYDDMQKYALNTLLNGGEIPGWKVVAGRSNRAFTDIDAAFAVIQSAGYDEALLYERKPITLSACEKLVGKKQFAELLDGFVTRPPGKPTLAPEDDKRERYSSAVSDFKEVVADG